MKFKLFSVVLLLVCFVFLGILAGVIPVTDGATAAAVPTASPPGPAGVSASASPRSSPAAVTAPSPRLAGTAAPESTEIIAGPTAVPEQDAGSAATPQQDAAGSPAPSPRVSHTRQPTPVPAAALDTKPTVSSAPSPTPEPEPAPAAVSEKTADLWQPTVQVISTTITCDRDPLQNDTSFDVDGTALLAQEPDITLPAEGYQILIIHTHGTEAFTPDGDDQYQATADYRTTDTDHSVIRVGQALGDALERQGLRVLVDQSLYDWPSYNGSYDRSQQAIEQYLQEYPGIAMVIDLHRDAIGDSERMYKTVSDKLDTPAAQIMFVMGSDVSLTHPNWRENLALAMSLQHLAEEKYPHLMRPTLLTPYRYNQQLTPGSVLLEIGTAGNTLQEAIAAAELFAEAVGPVLAEHVAA